MTDLPPEQLLQPSGAPTEPRFWIGKNFANSAGKIATERIFVGPLAGLHRFLHLDPGMLPRALPQHLPAPSHLPPQFLSPVALAEAKSEPPIRRYAMQWLQLAAFRVHNRSERTQRQYRFVRTVLGIDHLFDLSDVPRPRPAPLLLGSGTNPRL